jgi:uncharacterized protein
MSVASARLGSVKKRGREIWFDSRDLMRAQCSHCTALSVARELEVPELGALLAQFYQKPQNLAITYGMRFEADLERDLVANLGDLVAAPREQTMEATLDLIGAGVPVIYQGVLKGGSGSMPFSGRPDFLVRGDYQLVFTESGLTAVQLGTDSDRYSAWDAKLSQSPKPEYQVQVGLYADVLRSLNLASSSEHGLILGSRELAGFSTEVLISQMVAQREKFIAACEEVLDSPPQRIEDIGSLICDASSYCDICEYPALCDFQRRQTNHLQLVAGITRAAVESLHRSGVKSVAALASFSEPTDKLSQEQVEKLARQARLQQKTYDTGEVYCEVLDRSGLELLGELNPGDLFFDLEGFTFFGEPGGLEYLWGWTAADESFNYRWADTREEERLAFEAFMNHALSLQQQFPGCRIYHYANYEQVALRKLAARFGSFVAEVEELLGKGVLVDLYKVVKQSLVISQESYSIKKLEVFYSFGRSSDVKEAMGSMEYYDQYLNSSEVEREKLKRQVIAYNQDDCASTLALYKWLKTL